MIGTARSCLRAQKAVDTDRLTLFFELYGESVMMRTKSEETDAEYNRNMAKKML